MLRCVQSTCSPLVADHLRRATRSLRDEGAAFYKRLSQGYLLTGVQTIVDPYWDEATASRLFRVTPEDADFTLSMFSAMIPPQTVGFTETGFGDLLARSTGASHGFVARSAYNELPSKYGRYLGGRVALALQALLRRASTVAEPVLVSGQILAVPQGLVGQDGVSGMLRVWADVVYVVPRAVCVCESCTLCMTHCRAVRQAIASPLLHRPALTRRT